jgi:hypothetical protein
MITVLGCRQVVTTLCGIAFFAVEFSSVEFSLGRHFMLRQDADAVNRPESQISPDTAVVAKLHAEAL